MQPENDTEPPETDIRRVMPENERAGNSRGIFLKAHGFPLCDIVSHSGVLPSGIFYSYCTSNSPGLSLILFCTSGFSVLNSVTYSKE